MNTELCLKNIEWKWMNDISFDPQDNSYGVDLKAHSLPLAETGGYLQGTPTELI